MAPLGPFGGDRRVVVGVSGGADSMALAWLLRRWGDPLAVVVDHGLRAESAVEAAVTSGRLAAMRIPARLVRLDDLRAGPGLGARARAARYAALLQVCREAGRPDLFIAHHRQDQAETALLREAAGSGPAGLAGMAAVAWRDDARILRPLVTVEPARLRAVLCSAGVDWVEDPTNTDPATARGGLRAIGVPDGAAEAAGQAGWQRAAADTALADELGRTVTLYPTGHAEVRGALSAAAWSALVWTVSGRAYPPPRAAVRRLGARSAATLHGVQVVGGLVVREAAAMAAPVAAVAGTVWDGRFLVRDAPHGWVIGALGADAARLRHRPGLPSAVLRTLPALRRGMDLLTVPDLLYPDHEVCLSVKVDFRPSRPMAGSPFMPAMCGAAARGCTWGGGTPCRKSRRGTMGSRACDRTGPLGTNDEQFRP